MARHAAQYQHGSLMDIPVSGPTLSLTDSIGFDSKINDLTKVKPPTKEETHSLKLIIMFMLFHRLLSACTEFGSLCKSITQVVYI